MITLDEENIIIRARFARLSTVRIANFLHKPIQEIKNYIDNNLPSGNDCYHCGQQTYQNISLNTCDHCYHKHHEQDYMIMTYFLNKVSHNSRREKRTNNPSTITAYDIYLLYIKQEGKCFYSGKEMNILEENKDSLDSLTLDQVIPGAGYIKNNIVLTTKEYNVLKNNFSLIELQKFLPRMHDKIISKQQEYNLSLIECNSKRKPIILSDSELYDYYKLREWTKISVDFSELLETYHNQQYRCISGRHLFSKDNKIHNDIVVRRNQDNELVLINNIFYLLLINYSKYHNKLVKDIIDDYKLYNIINNNKGD